MNRFLPRQDAPPNGQEPRFLAFFGRRRGTTPDSLDQPKSHPREEAWELALLFAVFIMIGIVFFAHIFGSH